ncbi:glycosyltransferase family 2 protein [Microbacterium lacticum]
MISIACVIPTHGRPEYLAEALESVFGQQGVRVSEVVVVDDIGTAETESIVRGFADRELDVRVQYLHRTEGAPGASASRNAGFAATISEYVAFLDDDDYWKPEYLLDASRALDASGAGLCLTWMLVDEANGPTLDHFSPRLGLKLADVLARNAGITGSNMVVRRGVFEAIAGFDAQLPVSNDKDFLVRYLAAGLDYMVVDRRNVVHRRHTSGQLTEWNERRAAALEKYITKHDALLSRQDRRFLERQIHSIRFRTTSGTRKLVHGVLLIAKSAPTELATKLARRAGFRSPSTQRPEAAQ